MAWNVTNQGYMRLKLQYIDNVAVLAVCSYNSHFNSSNIVFKSQKGKKKIISETTKISKIGIQENGHYKNVSPKLFHMENYPAELSWRAI